MFSDVESKPCDELLDLQTDRLSKTVNHAYENVPFYRERFDAAGISPEDIRSPEDLERLEFTTKEELLEYYPDGMVAVPTEDVVRVHASSGTGGKPKIVSYTEHDLEIWDEVVARLYASGGLTSADTYQVSLGYGLFTGGFGFHHGAEKIGARIVPMSSGNTEQQLQMMRDLETDAIGLVTSYALYMAETAVEMGLDPRTLPVSTIFVGGEQTTTEMIDTIAETWGADVYSNYGLSEIIGPGVAAQCSARSDTMHVQEDHFYPEVIDPDTGKVVGEGEEGELVLTTLTKEALPLIRYRTGDVTSLHYDECECGRSTVRMSHVTGRTDGMVTVRGTNLFASQIESVVYRFEELSPNYRIDIRREGTMDTLELTVERNPDLAGDIEGIAEAVTDSLSSVLQLRPDSVNVVEPQTLERTEVGKVKRLYDHRSA